MDRRRFLLATSAALAAGALPQRLRAKPADAPLRLAGPWASVSFPLLWMASRPGYEALAPRIEFSAWNNPDELRLIALEGRADFIALPSNVAANLFNRGVDLRLQCISAWGLLYLVSRQPAISRLAALGEAELGVPFRGDMPEIVLRQLAVAQGLDPRRDLRLRYLASPLDAIQLLLTRRLDHALLAEPAVSMTLLKSREGMTSLIAPELHRALDLQQAWAQAGLGPERLPQAGVAALGETAADAALCARFAAAHHRALAECMASPDACGALVAERSGRLDARAVADSLAHSRLQIVPAAAARPELEPFLQRLLADQPGLVGGRLPGDAFYAGA
jgi:NitT/TauT family transport system substrate-binding protein